MMAIDKLLLEIDSEIARLQQARALLAGNPRTRGRKQAAVKTAVKKRNLSPEARKRIADAQKKRWAAQKKAAK